MYSGQDFVDVLKKISYPGAEKLEGSSFDYMFENVKCLPILECFCSSIEERNVLTPEELTELETLPSDDLSEESLNILKHHTAKSVLTVETQQQEVSDEIAFLKSELDGKEKHRKLLKLQISKLSLQKEKLSRETENIETTLKYERKMLKKLQDEVQTVKQKFAADLKHLFTAIQDARSIMTRSPGYHSLIPPRKYFQLNLKPYLKAERNALQNVKSYVSALQNECQGRTSCDPEDGLHESTMTSNPEDKMFQQLALQLQNLKVSEEKLLKLSFEQKKAETSLQFYEEKINIDRYRQASPMLRVHLEEAQKTRKRLEKEEKRLLLLVPEVVQEYIAKQHNGISIAYVKEKLAERKSLLVKQTKPLNILSDQVTRLCALQMLMLDEKRDLKNFCEFMLNAMSTFKSEVLRFQERETEKNDLLAGAIPSNENCISEGSILSSLQKILDVDCYLTPDDLLEKARKLLNRDCELNENLETKFHEQMQSTKSVESHAACLNELLYESQWSSVVHPENLLHTATSDINKIHLKVQELEDLIMKEMTNFHKKEKVIRNNTVMKKSRDLFIFALTNPLRLEKALQELKLLAENRKLRRAHNLVLPAQ